MTLISSVLDAFARRKRFVLFLRTSLRSLLKVTLTKLATITPLLPLLKLVEWYLHQVAVVGCQMFLNEEFKIWPFIATGGKLFYASCSFCM